MCRVCSDAVLDVTVHARTVELEPRRARAGPGRTAAPVARPAHFWFWVALCVWGVGRESVHGADVARARERAPRPLPSVFFVRFCRRNDLGDFADGGMGRDRELRLLLRDGAG